MAVERIQVMVFEPGREAHFEGIKNRIDVYENIVGGKTQIANLDRDTVLVYNKDNKSKELLPNRYVGQDIICGTFFIAKDTGNELYESIEQRDARYYAKLYGQPESISKEYYLQHLKFGSPGIGRDEYFINNLNKSLDSIDFEKVVESYKNPELSDAKDLLKLMHEEFYEAFGTDHVDDIIDKDDIFIHLPAVLKSIETGEICIGMVYVDIESSGEHWGTQFAFNKGFVSQDDKNKKNPMVEKKDAFGRYDYWYTPTYHGDIHTGLSSAPPDVRELIEYARQDTEQEQGMNMDRM